MGGSASFGKMPLTSKRGRYGSYSFRRTPNRVARGIGYAGALGAGLAGLGSYLGGGSRNLRGSNVRSGQGVTQQSDRRQVYRKKRMPRRKKAFLESV